VCSSDLSVSIGITLRCFAYVLVGRSAASYWYCKKSKTFRTLLIYDLAPLRETLLSFVCDSVSPIPIAFLRFALLSASILVTVFDFLMALIIYIGILFYFGYEASILRVIVYLPVSVILTVLTTFGLGSFLAALNVKYRDFQYAIPFMIQFLLFINPVLYSTSIFQSPNAKYFMALNPVSTAINISRAALNGTPLDLSLILISSLSVIAFLILGIYTFRKTEAYFADIA
jgi:lipopolysaccharide transport system permease protein